MVHMLPVLLCLLLKLNSSYQALENAPINLNPENVTSIKREYASLRLPRLKPLKPGKVHKVSLSGEEYEVRTLGRIPPIFEIKSFLTPDECDFIIARALRQGLEISTVAGESIESTLSAFYTNPLNNYSYWDLDDSGYIDVEEFRRMLEDNIDFSLDEKNAKKMLSDLLLDFDGDGKVSHWEFKAMDVSRVATYIHHIKDTQPRTKSRHSSQAWLPHPDDENDDVVMRAIENRVSDLTGLPLPLIYTSEELQVVRYEPGGHYNCHLDTEISIDTAQCCHLTPTENCVVCRYATILYFLNEVEDGGETAFPIADNTSFDSQIWERDNERICDLARNCHKSNVVVKPEKGKAVLWYNHRVHPKTGWLGRLDYHSFHGGCDVKRGIKWIANQWFNVSPWRESDLENWEQARESAADESVSTYAHDEL